MINGCPNRNVRREGGKWLRGKSNNEEEEKRTILREEGRWSKGKLKFSPRRREWRKSEERGRLLREWLKFGPTNV